MTTGTTAVEQDATAQHADIDFYFDLGCPFAWMTGKWVHTVAAQRDYRVRWRFISLRMLNAHLDCELAR